MKDRLARKSRDRQKYINEGRVCTRKSNHGDG